MAGTTQVNCTSVASSIFHPHNLFNDEALSDVKIKLQHGQHLFGHKAILARQSDWFFRAFTGKFPVASSGEICLDDEDDPKAILAMVRHIYGFPYDYSYGTGLLLPPLIKDMMFHVNVFAAADKYDVPSLRVLVIKKFTLLMEQRYSSSQKELCAVIQRLCGPAAANFADTPLQKSAASFCSEHIKDLIKLDEFVSMLEEGEPFAGRLLTTVLRGSPDSVIKTVICQQCRLLSDDAIKKNIGRRCINNCHPNSQGTGGAFGSMGNFSTPRLEHYKDFMPL